MRFSRELTQEEMDDLKSIHDSNAIIRRFFDIALTDIGSSYDAEDTIDPKEFAIPEKQWREIATHIVVFEGQFNWMNIGPSTCR